ncbi:hypothetical protein E8E14_012552 [Neopestalotiopsis sp. 37M]|nr:hypothetical protein E8E14_012552 [Neopestalotiopsis sp. 37M]
MPDNAPVASVQTAFSCLKSIVFILELRQKEIQPGVRSPSSDERASIISRLFIWWLLPLLRLGQQKTPLKSESLPEIEHILTRAGDSKDPCGQGSGTGSGHENADTLVGSSIFHHIFAVRKWLILSAIPSRLAYTGFIFAQPFLITRATEWLAEPLNNNTYKVGGGLIAAYVIVYVGLGASQAFYRQCTARAVTAVRADLVSKIHSHSLKLSASSPARDSASTLMSADVERFTTGTRNMHEAWASPIELAIGLFILQTQIGLATAAVGGLTLVFVGFTGLIAGSAGKRQNEWLKGMEMRIVGTTQALKAMKGIKMTGASAVVRRDILALRRAEVRRMRKFRQVMVLVLWSMFIPVIMGPIIAFTVYNVQVGPKSDVVLTPAAVYQVLTTLGIFGNNIGQMLQSSVDIVTAGASLKRIESFLLSENTREDKRALLPGRNSRLPAENDDDLGEPLLPRAQAHGGAIRLKSMRRKMRNYPITLRLSRACAGWSTEGPMVVSNANFEASSPSVVAVVGPTGSGKTTLLRMVLGETEHSEGVVGITSRHIGYCSQAPWLTHASIRENIIGLGVFEERWYNTVLQVTALHKDVSMMAEADETVIGNAGGSLSGGQKKRIALARAIYSRAPILILDDPFNGLDGRTENEVLDALFGPQGLLRKHPASSDLTWPKQTKFADRVITLTDSGDIRRRDSLLAKFRRTNASWLDEESGDEDEYQTPNIRPSSTLEVIGGLVVGRDYQKPSSVTGGGLPAPAKDPAAYRYYIGGGGKRKFLIFLVIIAGFIAASMVGQVWAVRWAQNNVVDPDRHQNYYIGVYFVLGAVQLLSWSVANLFFMFAIAEKSADRCHAALLDTVLDAPMSFSDSTAAGKTINRFSQDLQLIDTELPYNLLGTVTQFFGAIGQCGIIIYGAPWSGLAIPVVAAAVYWLQRTYLPTSRQLRQLEIESKAPLFSQFQEALSGLATIRAMRWQAAYRRKNQAAVKTSQKPFFLLFAAQNWLNLMLDLITAALAVTIIAIGVATRSQANATLGLALFGASSFGASAKNVIQHWTELEISMGAIERVRAFTVETASERNDRVKFVSTSSTLQVSAAADDGHKEWSGQGSITFSSGIYPLISNQASDMPFAAEQEDGINITTTSPNALRQRFITLPQDPVLIGGTVRHNLQLYGHDHTEEEMAAALDAFGLWDTIQQKGGLDVDMGDELLSHGQRQLFCFARSTLQRGKNIVIFDEPSSQADHATEQKIETAIRDRFEHHTVLCVAHKLRTILSFDMVLVLNGGVIAERGNPRALLEDRTSLFATLMQSQSQQAEGG